MRYKGFPFAMPRRAAGAFAAGALAAAGTLIASAVPAAAVIYCTGPGYPRGCVVRPVVRAPVARTVIYCTRPGYPVGCVGTANARAIARPGPGVNFGGPVNRPGLR